MKLFHVFTISLLFGLSSALPAPQSSSSSSTSSSSSSASSSSEDAAEDTPVLDFLGGVFGFLQGAAETVQRIAEDKNVQKTVDGLLKMGANVTEVAVEVTSELLTSGPQALERSGGIVRGLVKASNDTGPIVKKNLDELEDFGKLLSTFIKQYSSLALENLEKFLSVYNRRLKCHMECTEKTSTARKTCEALYCDGFDVETFEFEYDLDDLMYDLEAKEGAFEGLTDEDVAEILDKAKKDDNEVN